MDHSIELQLMPDVLAAQQGDMAAYQRLISRCRQMVSSIALAIVKDLDRSEDVAQQVFIHVWQQLPQLRAEGWQIHMRPDFQYNLAEVDDWYAEVEEDPQQNWFDLELGIEVEGQRLSLLPILLQAIRRTPWLLAPEALAQRADEDRLLVNLPQGGKRIALPFARLKPLLATLGELYFRDPGDDHLPLRLGRADAARLAELAQGPELSWQGGDELRGFAQRLQNLAVREIAPPEGLQAELRSYQLQGLNWMQTLAELRVGGVLADPKFEVFAGSKLRFANDDRAACRVAPVVRTSSTSSTAGWTCRPASA